AAEVLVGVDPLPGHVVGPGGYAVAGLTRGGREPGAAEVARAAGAPGASGVLAVSPGSEHLAREARPRADPPRARQGWARGAGPGSSGPRQPSALRGSRPARPGGPAETAARQRPAAPCAAGRPPRCVAPDRESPAGPDDSCTWLPVPRPMPGSPS